jgi:Domain of unknown function (DUF5666)
MTRQLPTLAVMAAAAAALAGCAGSPASPSSAVAATSSPSAGQFPTGGGGGFGVFGTLAAISGKTLQVQNPQSGQVAVTYSTATAFRQTVKVAASALAVGDCVVVASASSTGASPSPSAITASTVSISKPTASGCVRGNRAGGNGGAVQGTPRPRPSNFPGQGGRARFGVAIGKVTAISGNNFTVTGSDVRTSAVTTTEVQEAATTSWTETVASNASALRVGECIAANGPTDSSATVAARSITMSTAVAGACTGGFRGGFGGGFGGGGGVQGGSNGQGA